MLKATLIAIGAARAGVSIGGGSVRFGLRESGVVDIESIDWRLHGGELHAAGSIDPSAEENRLVVSIEDLDLAELAEQRDDDEIDDSKPERNSHSLHRADPAAAAAETGASESARLTCCVMGG